MTNSHPMVLELMDQIYKRIPVTSSGTYNKMDPTHYQRGELTFTFRTRTYTIAYNDITWGIEFNLLLHTPGGIEILMSNWYMSHEAPRPDILVKRDKWFPHTYAVLREIRKLPLLPEYDPHYYDNWTEQDWLEHEAPCPGGYM